MENLKLAGGRIGMEMALNQEMVETHVDIDILVFVVVSLLVYVFHIDQLLPGSC